MKFHGSEKSTSVISEAAFSLLDVNWTVMANRVVYNIASRLLQQGNYQLALQLLKNKLLTQEERDVDLRYLLAKIVC